MATDTPGAGTRSFSSFLQDVEDGRLHADLTEDLRELVGAMRRHAASTGGKPTGQLSVSLKFKLDGGVFEVVSDIKVVPPKPLRARSIFYGTPDDALSSRNPRQLDLGIEARDVSTPAATTIRALR